MIFQMPLFKSSGVINSAEIGGWSICSGFGELLGSQKAQPIEFSACGSRDRAWPIAASPFSKGISKISPSLGFWRGIVVISPNYYWTPNAASNHTIWRMTFPRQTRHIAFGVPRSAESRHAVIRRVGKPLPFAALRERTVPTLIDRPPVCPCGWVPWRRRVTPRGSPPLRRSRSS